MYTYDPNKPLVNGSKSAPPTHHANTYSAPNPQFPTSNPNVYSISTPNPNPYTISNPNPLYQTLGGAPPSSYSNAKVDSETPYVYAPTSTAKNYPGYRSVSMINPQAEVQRGHVGTQPNGDIIVQGVVSDPDLKINLSEFHEPKKVHITECRGSKICLMGKVQDVLIENCNHSIILFEALHGIQILDSEALTLVAGGSRAPVVKVQDSREISIIAHLDAMRDPVETHGCTGITIFAVQDLAPNATPEALYSRRQNSERIDVLDGIGLLQRSPVGWHRYQHLVRKAGIGLMLKSETVDIWGNQKFVVASLLEGGAAQMSGGIQIGDALIAVDDVPVDNESLKRVGDLIAGPVGTWVRLTLERNGQRLPHAVSILRGPTQKYQGAPSAEEQLALDREIFPSTVAFLRPGAETHVATRAPIVPAPAQPPIYHAPPTPYVPPPPSQPYIPPPPVYVPPPPPQTYYPPIPPSLPPPPPPPPPPDHPPPVVNTLPAAPPPAATTPVVAAAQPKTPAVVSVTVVEARNLFFDEKKKCDPFVSLRLEAPHYQLQAGRTQIKHGTITPSWSELFNFTVAVDAVQSSRLQCSVLNADGRPTGSEPVFGTVQSLSVQSIIHETSAKPMDAWFDLEPVQGGTFPPGPKPQVRLIIQGTEPGKFNEKLFVPPGKDPLSKDTHATPAATPGHSPTVPTGNNSAPSSVSVPKTDKRIRYVTLERISRDGKGRGTVGISFSKADIREPFTIDNIELGSSAYHDQTLRVGDVIIQVDNHPVRNLSAQQVAELIGGDAGSKVVIAYEPK